MTADDVTGRPRHRLRWWNWLGRKAFAGYAVFALAWAGVFIAAGLIYGSRTSTLAYAAAALVLAIAAALAVLSDVRSEDRSEMWRRRYLARLDATLPVRHRGQ
jgi:hypothetical protein